MVLPSTLRLLLVAMTPEVVMSCDDTAGTLRTGGSDLMNDRLLIHRDDSDPDR
jgi:hypothetical protein